MPELNGNPPPFSAEDSLPPVEPPSAGFILQLFVVPGIIVVIIVTVWLMFNWLAQKGSDPESYVLALERNNAARWQAAFNLAGALADQDPSQQALKQNTRLAGKLAHILEEEIRQGASDDKSISLRIYLCRALGRFVIPEPLPTLLQAAGGEEKSNQVRMAALQGIAMLADNLSPAQLATAMEDPNFQRVMQKAATDDDRLVRSTTAFALGVIGSKAPLPKPLADSLLHLLGDTYPDARYNAATGLARTGNAQCVAVLTEMLDPEESAGVDSEQIVEQRDTKRSVIQINALRATTDLAKHNATADLEPLRTAIEKLLAAKPNRVIQLEAASVLRRLNERAGGKAAPAKSSARLFDRLSAVTTV